MTRSGRAIAVVSIAASIMSCSGGGTAIQAIPTPANPIPTNAANMAGNWRGTLESSNFATRIVTLIAVQAAINCVDGSWATDPPEWAGAISGLTGAGNFSGQMSFEGPGGCNGIATVTGDVGDTSLTWTGSGFSASGCAQGTPQSIVLKLKRQ